jgi:anaerobic magnesium-protoporphyrin IX monomethyl ester cyclase
MNMMLVHPPLDDPTIPYHSTAYLKGHLRRNGFNGVTLRDLNVEFVNHLLLPATVASMFEESRQRIAALSRKSSLSYPHQEEYYRLLASLRAEPEAITRAASNLRDPKLFLDFDSYRRNVETLSKYMELLGAMSYPCEYQDFTPANRGRFSTGTMQDLLSPDLGEKVCAPFSRYFENVVARDPAFEATDLFGISVVYDHQIYHAFHLARMLRKRWPAKSIVFGGTAISQMYKYMTDKSRLKEVFTLCDAIVIGEGETAICEIADSGGDLAGRAFTNTITYSRTNDRLNFPVVRYENVVELGAPEYDHPWELYLSPQRGINYSPTRGCYWNRCTFCDYGLNTDKPTSPWRERKIDQVIEDLTRASRDFGVRYVYFAVDVMAPGYLDRLSDAIVDSDLDIRWSAELRMERIFTEERTKKMKKAGCVCVSFGMESGNQRVLDLIDKGTKVEYMGATMKNFSASGIACQIMAFTDFPTETEQEKEATHHFIRDNEQYWSAGGIGTFLLTGTSIIARNPEKFGIELVQIQGVDSPRGVAYRIKNETGQRLGLTEESDSSFDNHGDIFPSILGRPWAGGTDSLHTMIYYDAFGANFFKQHPAKELPQTQEIADDLALQCSIIVNGELVSSTFDLGTILKNRKRFLGYVEEQLAVPAEPTYSEFRRWAENIEPAAPAWEKESCWIVGMTRCVKIDKLVFQVLEHAAQHHAITTDLLLLVPEPIRAKLFGYLKGLENKGVISFQFQGRVLRSSEAAAEEEHRREVAGKMTPQLRITK